MRRGEQSEGNGGRRAVAAALDTAGWGLFFIWVGVAFLADVGWGAGLLGVGVIGLAMQALRRIRSIPVDWFGLTVGTMFTLAGAWQLLGLHLAGDAPGRVWPFISVVVGVLLVVSAWRRKARSARESGTR